MDTVTDYYVNQAGSGIPGFQGVKFQRGTGSFSSLWSRIGLPVLKFLGKQAVNTGLSVASDTLQGRKFRESAKKHLKSGGLRTLDYLKKLNEQSRRGKKKKKCIKRKRIKPKKTVKKKKHKRQRQQRKNLSSIFA